MRPKATTPASPTPGLLIYLHGLHSSSQSIKAQQLKRDLAPYEVLSFDYPAQDPDAAILKLSEVFTELGATKPAVVGSSMGGFYGQFIARRFELSHLFMINPALDPWTLTSAGVDAATLERTRSYAIENPCDGIPTTVFIDRGDEVVDHRIAERLYARCGRLYAWDGGDHAFQHLPEATEVIRAHLRAASGE